MVQFFFKLKFVYTSLPLSGNSGRLSWVRLQQPQEQCYPVRIKSACWVFSWFYNTPNSEMDYRILNVHTWSFLCVHIHTGVYHADSESAQHFLLGKTHKCLLCCTGFEPRVLGSQVRRDALPTEPPRQFTNTNQSNTSLSKSTYESSVEIPVSGIK